MRSYSLKQFRAEELWLLDLAAAIVFMIDDHEGSDDTGDDPAKLTRCHEVARIVATVVNHYADKQVLWVQDGRYGFCDHSWCWTSQPTTDWFAAPDRLACPNILDPYCVGSLPQVRLLSCSETSLPHFGLMYQLGPERQDIRHEWVAEQVKLVVERLDCIKVTKPEAYGLKRRLA